MELKRIFFTSALLMMFLGYCLVPDAMADQADLMVQFIGDDGNRKFNAWLNDGNQFVNQGVWFGSAKTDAQSPGLADFLGDGRLDLVFQFEQNGKLCWKARPWQGGLSD